MSSNIYLQCNCSATRSLVLSLKAVPHVTTDLGIDNYLAWTHLILNHKKNLSPVILSYMIYQSHRDWRQVYEEHSLLTTFYWSRTEGREQRDREERYVTCHTLPLSSSLDLDASSQVQSML